MKDNNLYRELKRASKEAKNASLKRNELEKAMNKEISSIKEKYKPIMEVAKKEAYEKSDKVRTIGDLYKQYSCFHRTFIENLFAILLSYIEGEKFIPFFTKDYIKENKIKNIIIKEKVSKKYKIIDDDILNELLEKGDLVLLNGFYYNIIYFYDNLGIPLFDFGNFTYLYEFLNRLIQYRIDNNFKDYILSENLYSFIYDFLVNNKELVRKNKEKRDKMLSEYNEDEIIVQCKKLELK